MKALTELDAYWKRVYEYAERTAAQNMTLMKDKSRLEAIFKVEVEARESMNADDSELSACNNKFIAENRYLRKMLRTYLYPDSACHSKSSCPRYLRSTRAGNLDIGNVVKRIYADRKDFGQYANFAASSMRHRT